MRLSKEAEEELRSLAGSEALKNDLAAVAASRHNPFGSGEAVDADAYIEFLCAYNDFINHEMKPFTPMVDKDMRL